LRLVSGGFPGVPQNVVGAVLRILQHNAHQAVPGRLHVGCQIPFVILGGRVGDRGSSQHRRARRRPVVPSDAGFAPGRVSNRVNSDREVGVSSVRDHAVEAKHGTANAAGNSRKIEPQIRPAVIASAAVGFGGQRVGQAVVRIRIAAVAHIGIGNRK
jgi:hypothetical protein